MYEAMVNNFGMTERNIPKVCLVSVVNSSTGQPIRDHVWITATPKMTKYLKPGAIIKFRAFMYTYKKNREWRIGFERVTITDINRRNFNV